MENPFRRRPEPGAFVAANDVPPASGEMGDFDIPIRMPHDDDRPDTTEGEQERLLKDAYGLDPEQARQAMIKLRESALAAAEREQQARLERDSLHGKACLESLRAAGRELTSELDQVQGDIVRKQGIALRLAEQTPKDKLAAVLGRHGLDAAGLAGILTVDFSSGALENHHSATTRSEAVRLAPASERESVPARSSGEGVGNRGAKDKPGRAEPVRNDAPSRGSRAHAPEPRPHEVKRHGKHIFGLAAFALTAAGMVTSLSYFNERGRNFCEQTGVTAVTLCEGVDTLYADEKWDKRSDRLHEISVQFQELIGKEQEG